MAIFLVLLSLPLINEQLIGFNPLPLQENRFRATRPVDWPSLFDKGLRYQKSYQKYFDDTYGLRDLLIRLRNQLKYSVLNESDTILMGRQGFLFYKSVLGDQIRLERIPKGVFDVMHERIVRLSGLLAHQGKTLLLIPIPLKNSVYPDMLPSCCPERPRLTIFDYHMMFLRGRSDLCFLDVCQELKRMKEKFVVFHKTDFHWNDRAGSEIARLLVNKLSALTSGPELWPCPRQSQLKTWDKGGQSLAMALLWPLTERSWFLREETIAECGTWHRPDNKRPNEWNYETFPECVASNLLKDTVILGDSMVGAFLRSGFTKYFVRIQANDNGPLRKLIRTIPSEARYVILEYIEPHLLHMIQESYWPDELL